MELLQDTTECTNKVKKLQLILLHQYLLGQGLAHRGKLDSNDELIKFSKTLEDVCINCVETGSMTKDLAILIDKNQKYLTTNQFLDAIDGNLKKKLN